MTTYMTVLETLEDWRTSQVEAFVDALENARKEHHRQQAIGEKKGQGGVELLRLPYATLQATEANGAVSADVRGRREAMEAILLRERRWLHQALFRNDDFRCDEEGKEEGEQEEEKTNGTGSSGEAVSSSGDEDAIMGRPSTTRRNSLRARRGRHCHIHCRSHRREVSHASGRRRGTAEAAIQQCEKNEAGSSARNATLIVCCGTFGAL